MTKTIREDKALAVSTQKRINWLHVSTLVAVAILVGTEMVGASWAAGWALGGLLQLDPMISRAIEILFAACGFVLLYYFMRTAIRNEPISD
ncbi:hypothetical protein [Beijerinckia mobilis]|uniref:hypothetical protein n=1 Tax=Beijerinckia mobilis TaxID=231434 RepID=UPI00068F3FF8|nr:hypothetical protein [Beijerinckia mobilis]